ncbi:MAG: phospholipid carrier-dependent glycosyltransferase, partial [Chloroflexi bacterium]|nr:phospholipid carrier-dependent glycosyltransferase [Chloroflexota bacterium]
MLKYSCADTMLAMKRQIEWAALAVILLVAAVLRLTGVDWDEYHHYHPDERYISWVATTIEWPDSLRTAFDPARSSFNPYYWPPDAISEGIAVERDQSRKFAYGHLPLYLGVAATRLAERLDWLTAVLPANWFFTRDILNGAERVEFRHLTAVVRAVTGLMDVGAVWLTFLLGRQLYDVKTGLLAAAFLAFNVMHIQLARFFAVDPYVTFFTAAAVYMMTRAVGAGKTSNVKRKANRLPTNLQTRLDHRSSLANLFLASAFVGLAVGSKFAAVMLFLPLTTTIWTRQLAARKRA